MRIARDISNRDLDVEEFRLRAESLVIQYPELAGLSWIDRPRRFRATYAIGQPCSPRSDHAGRRTCCGPAKLESIFVLARDCASRSTRSARQRCDRRSTAATAYPTERRTRFAVWCWREYSVDGLYRTACRPKSRPDTRFRCSTTRASCWPAPASGAQSCRRAAALGGSESMNTKCRSHRWATALVLRAQAYRTSLGVDRQRFVLAGRRAQRA